LLEPIEAGKADVVFGSRFISDRPHRVVYFWHRVGNHVLTLFSNMFSNLNLTDMETCYKMFRREIIQSIEIEESRFRFSARLLPRLLPCAVRYYEVGIWYYGRTYDEGKKIGWRGWAAGNIRNCEVQSVSASRTSSSPLKLPSTPRRQPSATSLLGVNHRQHPDMTRVTHPLRIGIVAAMPQEIALLQQQGGVLPTFLSLIEAIPDLLAVEMEEAAVAHVCAEHSVPLVVARIVSDRAGGTAGVALRR
jgi:hypothetical protein